MSGFEIVGVVLGTLPLIISAIEHYKDPLEEYSHYESTLKKLRVRLRFNQELFQDTLRRFLLPEFSKSQLDTLFPDITDVTTSAANWGKSEVQAQLRIRLGKRSNTFLDLVQEMLKVLEKLMEKLDLDVQGKARISFPVE
jgi:hypothetical protein